MKILVALVCGVLIAPTLHAQSLADALERAWARHPQAAALDARTAAARARGELATGLMPAAPAVSLGGLSGEHGKQEWEVELAAPLWLPGQKAARGRVAERALEEVAAQRDALRLDLAGELRALWWDVAAARAGHALATRRLASARALEAEVTRRYRAGDLSRMDANLARGEQLRAEAALRDAEAALTRAELAWQARAELPAPARLDEETARATDVDAAHPRLRALAAAALSARAGVEAARATRRESPELAVRVIRERGERGEAYGNEVGVKLKIPFASPPRQRLADAEALATARGADAEQALAAGRLQLDTRAARAELDAALAQLELARARAALAADTLALADKGFAHGELDLATLLRARAAADEAEATLAAQQVARVAAHSRLLQSLGVLP